MKIVTKRNAMLGWLTWKVGKGMAKKKARSAVPGRSRARSRKKPAIFAGLAAAVGITALLKRKRQGGEHSSDN
jgi:hypothetical protein